GGHLLEVGEQVAVCEARRLARAGGARREHEHGVVVLIAGDARRRVPTEQLLEGLGGVDPYTLGDEDALEVDGHTVDAGDRVTAARSDDGNAGPGRRQLAFELDGRRLRIERHGDAADAG